MLWRKMFRDIVENKMAYIACIVVIAIGLMAYTAMSMSKDNLFLAKDEFYNEYHFADGFAKVKAIPYASASALTEVEGVGAVSGRLVKDIRVLMPDAKENIYLRLISLHRPNGNELNGIKLGRGSFPEKNKRQILLAEKFYDAHQLKIGNKLDVIIDGKQVELTITGSGQSPEYVYALKDIQSLTPDPKTYEVAYMPYEDMGALFDSTGLVNDISFMLEPGFIFEDIEQKLKIEFKGYELEALYPAKDQMSNAMLTEELKQLDRMSGSIPIIFLAIAGIILYIMLKRLVESQRGQIGTMRAFGYSKWEVLFHYMFYGLFIGLAGGIVGGLLGGALSFSLINVYQSYFSFPDLTAQFSIKYFFLGITMSVLFSAAAAFQGVRGVLHLQPAEAMRPVIPVFSSKSWLEKVPSIWRLFNVQGRMAVRNIVRNKSRSFFTFIGMVFTFSMMASFFSLGSMMDIMIIEQFTKVQKQDAKISFSNPLPLHETVRELQHQQGVKLVEPFLEVPVSLRHLNNQKDVVALGIIESSTLYSILDKHGNTVAVPKTGIMLSEQIAAKLNVQVGDIILLDSPMAKDTNIKIKVESVVPQYLGANVYLNQSELLTMLKQGDMSTSALLAIEETRIPDLKDTYSNSKYVSNIEVRQEMIDKYNTLLGTSSYALWVMAVIAVVTGFAIVYNSSIISLAERERELTSLRVLGMTSREVLEVISFEQWCIGIAGMLAGIPLAILMNTGMATSMSSDLYSLPSVTNPDAIFQALLGTMFAIWISQWSVARRVKKLDLVGVLKERE